MATLQAESERADLVSQKREAVNTLLAHPLFEGAESLSALLKYLADHSLSSSAPALLKEHQIATELLGKSVDFDPRTDSSVRVHMSRLRSRIAEYYRATAGTPHRWIIELPKGGHLIRFTPGSAAPSQLESDPTPAVPSVQRRRVPHLAVWVTAGLATATALLFLARARPNSPFDRFWAAALRPEGVPLVVFSNAEFVGRPEFGLRYKRPEDGKADILDSYTGVGEVFAVNALHNVFDHIHRTFELRRARQLSWDEARTRDLILIGSPSENFPVSQLPVQKDFVFRVPGNAERPADLAVIDTATGKQYLASEKVPQTEDYAVVALTAVPSSGQRLILLAGTTTQGTEAAAEFVSNPDRVAELLARAPKGSNVTHLAALLHVTVRASVPVESSIVLIKAN